ncbi:MAG: peptidase [Pelobium sp.]
MTYCLGIKVKEGLIALADTRISSGTSVTTKKKVHVECSGNGSLFIMTSGLRSVRDKAVIYFQELMESGIEFDKMFKAVNALGVQIRRVEQEDNEALAKSGYKFNLNAIVGGQLKGDNEHKLFQIYPEGNWVELDMSCPYVIIGNSGQGKALLSRVLKEDTTLKQALKAGYLSFDSTRVSSNDVEFPIDVVWYEKDSYNMVEKRYEYLDMAPVSIAWAQKLQDALDEIPEEWMDDIL